jgi:solute carrier family 25 folate transporter 32
VSGMTAGGLSTLILHPIDLVKVRLQADTKHDYRSHSFLYTFRLMSDLRSTFGMRALYQGLSANLLGSVSSWGIYFMLYEWLKRKEFLENQYFASATIAGAVTQLFTNPIWLAKTRLCLQDPNPAANYSGLYDCLRKVYQK